MSRILPSCLLYFSDCHGKNLEQYRMQVYLKFLINLPSTNNNMKFKISRSEKDKF